MCLGSYSGNQVFYYAPCEACASRPRLKGKFCSTPLLFNPRMACVVCSVQVEQRPLRHSYGTSLCSHRISDLVEGSERLIGVFKPTWSYKPLSLTV